MSAIEHFLPPAVVEKLGWALVHFTWQATGIALLLAATLALLRNASAKARYAASCLALSLMVLAPAATLLYTTTKDGEAGEDAPPAEPSPREPRAGFVGTRGVWIGPAAGEPADEPAAVEPGTVASSPGWGDWMSRTVQKSLPWVVLAWTLGVLALSVRNLGGFVQVQMLKHRHVRRLDAQWQWRFEALARRLSLRCKVRFLESLVLEVPAAIGWLRPVVLIPASVLTGIRPDLLEAVLLHELAHIRRHDYLVNLVQTVVETLGFFHPAVWWVSRQIRLERENCCDDVAVEALGDRPRFARALVRLEEIRNEAPHLAVAGTGGILMQRIARLVAAPSARGNGSVCGTALAMVCLALLLPLASVLGAEPPTADELLRKFAEAQDQMKSFVLKSDVSTEHGGAGREGVYATHNSFEARSDGQRWSVRWLEVDHTTTDHMLCWWDGKLLTQFHRRYRDNAIVIDAANRPTERFFTWFGAGMASGYMPFDTERVDVILGKARKVTVRPKPERAAAADCYVLDADTERGKYSLWIAPKFGHHIAKVKIERGGGDRIFGGDSLLPKGHVMRESLDSVRFEQRGGVWVPVETRSSGHQRTPQGSESWDNVHFKVHDITVNPDHQAIGSFRASKDRLEGAQVLAMGLSDYIGVWQDGKIVRNDGQILELDDLLKQLRAAQKPAPEEVKRQGQQALRQARQQAEERAEKLVRQAEAESEAGSHEQAVATLKEAEKQLWASPDSPLVVACAYNMACAYSRLGKKAEAIASLRKAVSLGFSNTEHLRKDPDLANIRDEKAYKEIVAAIEKNSEAPVKR